MSELKDPTTLNATLAKLEEKFKVKLIDTNKSIKTESVKSDSTKVVPKIDVDTLSEESKPLKVLVRQHDSLHFLFLLEKKLTFSKKFCLNLARKTFH